MTKSYSEPNASYPDEHVTNASYPDEFLKEDFARLQSVISPYPEESDPIDANEPITPYLFIHELVRELTTYHSADEKKKIFLYYLSHLEKSFSSYLNSFKRINTLHKDSVQSAVDIIQSKRIEFLEEGESIDSHTLFLTVVMLVFIEFGFAGAIGARVITGLFRSLTKISLKVFPKTTLKFAGVFKSSFRELKKHDDNLKNLYRSFYKTQNQMSKSYKKRSWDEFNKEMANLRKISDKIIDIEKDKDVLKLATDGKVKDFVSMYSLNRTIERTLKEKKCSEIITNSLKVGKGPTNNFSVFAKAQPIFNSHSIPLDVAFKTQVQNIFDNQVFFLEESLKRIQSIKNYCESLSIEVAGPSILRFFGEISKYEDIYSLSEILDFEIEDYSVQKDNLVAIYELIIWVLIFGPNFKIQYLLPVRLDPFLPRLQYIYLTEKEYQALDETTKSRVKQRVKSSDIVDKILKYFHYRFYPSKDITDIDIAKNIQAIYEEINKIKDSIIDESKDLLREHYPEEQINNLVSVILEN